MGVYRIKAHNETDAWLHFSNNISGVCFGAYPRISFDWWRVNFNIDMNLILGMDAGVRVGGRRGVAVVKNSYVTFTLGFFWFGRKRT